MSADLTLVGTFAPLSIIVLFYIFARLSERLGSVERMMPRYRYYYVAIGFLCVGYLGHLLAFRVSLSPEEFPAWLNSAWFNILVYYIPMSIGVTIGTAVTWRYWSWIIIQHNR